MNDAPGETRNRRTEALKGEACALSELADHLAMTYPSLQLKAGLIWRWPGVRFDLWPDMHFEGDTEPPMYRYEFRSLVYERALEIATAANSPSDDLFFVVDSWREKENPTQQKGGLRVLRRYLKCTSLLLGVAYDEIPYIYADSEEEARSVLTCRFHVRCKAENIRWRNLVTAIAHQDFPGLRPQVGQDCFFVNISRKTITHMYDDRGIDLIAADPASLVPLVHRFRNWVMEDHL